MRKNIKRMQAILMTGIMTAALMGGCGNKEQSEEKESDAKAEVSTEISAEDVTLPENFDTMVYPMKALAMEIYQIGSPYYVQFSDDSSRESFWYSCALTAYYLHENEDWDLEVTSERFDMIVSALYASYQQGNLEFPDIMEGCAYAAYNDDIGGYTFSSKDEDYVADALSGYSLYITSCEETDDCIEVTAQLRDQDSWDVLGTYYYSLNATEYDSEDNPFAYSVSSLTDITESGGETESGEYESDAQQEVAEENPSESDTGTTEAVQETDSEETDTQEEEESESEEDTSPEETPDDYQEEYDDTDPDENQGGSISQSDAQSLAESYYGSDTTCVYQGTQSIDGYDYYMFSAEGENASKPYILVSASGGDVIGASKNSDGSWSFDQ